MKKLFLAFYITVGCFSYAPLPVHACTIDGSKTCVHNTYYPNQCYWEQCQSCGTETCEINLGPCTCPEK